MTAFDPIAWTLSVHGTLAGLSLAGFYKYGDRTASFSKIVEELDTLKASLRARISVQLEEQLGPVFERAPGDSHFAAPQAKTKLLVPSGYSEQAASPLGSDAYREAIRTFLTESGTELLSTHWGLRRAIHRWCDASRLLSWILLIALAWELLCCAVFGLFAKLGDVSLPGPVNAWSFFPTALLTLAFLWCLISALWNHDTIMRHRRQHDDL